MKQDFDVQQRSVDRLGAQVMQTVTAAMNTVTRLGREECQLRENKVYCLGSFEGTGQRSLGENSSSGYSGLKFGMAVGSGVTVGGVLAFIRGFDDFDMVNTGIISTALGWVRLRPVRDDSLRVQVIIGDSTAYNRYWRSRAGRNLQKGGAKVRASSIYGALTLSYDLPEAAGWGISPYVSVRHQKSKMGSFKEKVDGMAFPVHFQGGRAKVTTSAVGTEISATFGTTLSLKIVPSLEMPVHNQEITLRGISELPRRTNVDYRRAMKRRTIRPELEAKFRYDIPSVNSFETGTYSFEVKATVGASPYRGQAADWHLSTGYRYLF